MTKAKEKETKTAYPELPLENIIAFAKKLSESVDVIMTKLKTPGVYDVSEEFIEADKLYFDMLHKGIEGTSVWANTVTRQAYGTWRDYKEARKQYSKLLSLAEEYELRLYVTDKGLCPMKKKIKMSSVLLILSKVRGNCKAILLYDKKGEV